MTANKNSPKGGRTVSVRRSVLISTLGNIAAPLSALISSPILAQVLGVDGRGAVAAATAPLVLALSAVTFGLPEAVTFYTASRPGAAPQVYRRAALYISTAGLIGTGLIFWAASALSGGNVDLAALIRLAALMLLPALLLSVTRGYAAGRQHWSRIAFERLIGSGSRLTAIIILAATSSLTALTGTIAISLTTAVGLIAYIPIRSSPSLAARHAPTEPKPRVLSFGMRMWIGSLTGILLSRLDQMLMTPLASTYELGIYVVGVNVAEAVMVFNSAVRDVTFSTESRRPSDARLAQASRVSTLVTALSGVFVALVAIPLVPFFFGHAFAPSLPIAWILLLGIVLGNPGSVAGAGLSARNHPGMRSLSLAIALVVNVALLIALVPTLGAQGAAWATFAGNVIASTLNILWLKILFGMKPSSYFTVHMSDLRYLLVVLRNLMTKITSR